MKRAALLVGINRYQDPGINRLLCAEKDAIALDWFLRNQCGFETHSLINDQATKQAIADCVRRMCADLDPGDVFLFYFAGHGHDDPQTGQQVLLPVEVRLQDIEDHWQPDLVPVRGIEAATAPCGASRFLLFDACRTPLRSSARDAAPRLEEGTARDIQAMMAEARGNPPLVTLCACSPNQRAFELEVLGRGVFSVAFERILAGHAGRGQELALPSRAQEELAQQMAELLRQHGRAGNQDPMLSANRGRVVLLEGRPEAVAAAAEDRAQRPRARTVALARASEEALRGRLAQFAREQCRTWSQEDWQKLLLELHDEGTSTGWKTQEIERLLGEEKQKWLEAEARRKEEEARLAEARCQAAEEAERNRRADRDSLERRRHEAQRVHSSANGMVVQPEPDERSRVSMSRAVGGASIRTLVGCLAAGLICGGMGGALFALSIDSMSGKKDGLAHDAGMGGLIGAGIGFILGTIVGLIGSAVGGATGRTSGTISQEHDDRKRSRVSRIVSIGGGILIGLSCAILGAILAFAIDSTIGKRDGLAFDVGIAGLVGGSIGVVVGTGVGMIRRASIGTTGTAPDGVKQTQGDNQATGS